MECVNRVHRQRVQFISPRAAVSLTQITHDRLLLRASNQSRPNGSYHDAADEDILRTGNRHSRLT